MLQAIIILCLRCGLGRVSLGCCAPPTSPGPCSAYSCWLLHSPPHTSGPCCACSCWLLHSHPSPHLAHALPAVAGGRSTPVPATEAPDAKRPKVTSQAEALTCLGGYLGGYMGGVPGGVSQITTCTLIISICNNFIITSGPSPPPFQAAASSAPLDPKPSPLPPSRQLHSLRH